MRNRELDAARKRLGLGVDATEADINRTFRKLSRGCHPDTSDSKEDEFNELTRARETLLSSLPSAAGARREQYLRNVREQFSREVVHKLVSVVRGGVSAKMSFTQRVICTKCRGTRVRDLSTTPMCAACDGRSFIETSQCSTSSCSLCFASGYAITMHTRCQFCRGAGFDIVVRHITVDVPDNVREGDQLAVIDDGIDDVLFFASFSTPEDVKRPSKKSRT